MVATCERVKLWPTPAGDQRTNSPGEAVTYTNDSTPVGPTDGTKAGVRRGSSVAIGLAVASLVLTILLVPFFPVPALLPLIALIAVIGLVALILAIRARTAGAGGTALLWARILGVVGLVGDVILIGIIAFWALSGPSVTPVELRAQGGPTFTVTFADDFETYTETFQSDGFKRYTTEKSTAEITVTSPDDADDESVSCQILWDGKVVVDETGTGTVTCSYDAG